MGNKDVLQNPKVIKLPGEDIPVKKVKSKANMPAIIKFLKSLGANADPVSRH